jgi:hypothetical protein
MSSRLGIKTIEAHKTNAMQRLDMTGRVDIVRYALLAGWKYPTICKFRHKGKVLAVSTTFPILNHCPAKHN